MKIVFLGNFFVDYSSETHHKKSLEALGHEVIPLQEGHASGEEILRAAEDAQLFIWIHTHGWFPTGAMRMPEVLQRIRDMCVPSVTYHLDLYLGIGREHELLPGGEYDGLDYFFTVDKFMVDWLHTHTPMKAHFLPPAVYHAECAILPPQPVDYTTIFVGSRGYHAQWPFRPVLIDFLRGTYDSQFLHVGGDGQTGTVRGLELNQIYANAKIAVGDTLSIDFNYPYYSSDRLWESIGRGAFTIYPRIQGLEEYFTDGKEVVFYEHGNLADLKHKIDYYLTHDDEREAIRQAGFERCKREGTYLNRWQTILNTLELGD